MRIAVVGGGPGGLYFAALARQLDPGSEITVWERNAADDTFGFGVVFSDETLGGIEHADERIYRAMEREFARWDDIDVHVKGQTITSGGHGFAALAGGGCCRSCRQRCAELGVTVHFRAEARTRPRSRRLTTWSWPRTARTRRSGRRRDAFRPDARRPALPVHVARHRPGLRRVQVLHRADAARRHAGARIPLRRDRQHVHRRDARLGLAERGIRPAGPGRTCRRAPRTRRRSSGSASCSRACSTVTRCTPTTPSGSASARCAARAGGTAT